MDEQAWDPANLPATSLPADRSFVGFLALNWLEVSPSTAHVQFEIRDDLKQPFGLLHGGIYCSVAETVASVVTTQRVYPQGFTAVGLSNSASFLRPVTTGMVDVVARLRHRGETEWLWAHDFRDEQERLCALVDVTIAVRPARRE